MPTRPARQRTRKAWSSRSRAIWTRSPWAGMGLCQCRPAGRSAPTLTEETAFRPVADGGRADPCVFDGDKAGRRAALPALDVAMATLPVGKSLRFAMLPHGPGSGRSRQREVGRKGHDAGAGCRRFPLIDVLWRGRRRPGPWRRPSSVAGLRSAPPCRQALRIHQGRNAAAALSRCDRCASVGAVSRGAPTRRRASGFAQRWIWCGTGWSRLRFRRVWQGAKTPGMRLPNGYRPSPALLRLGIVHPQGGRCTGRRRAAGGDHSLPASSRIPICSKSRRRSWQNLISPAQRPGRSGPFCWIMPHRTMRLEHDLVAGALARAGLARDCESLYSRMVPSLRWILDPHADGTACRGRLKTGAIILHRRAYTLT